MKYFITSLALIWAFTSPVLAADGNDHSQTDHSQHEHPETTETPVAKAAPADANCNDAVVVKVNGLVCDFCARALEKTFAKREEVHAIVVDLDQGAVTVNMKPGRTIDDATLTEIITDSGYNVTAIDPAC